LARSARVAVRNKATGEYIRHDGREPRVGASGFDVVGDGHPAYEAASHGRRLHHWRPGDIGPNAALAFNLPALRNRSRDQVRQNAVASRASDVWVSNLIGTGIRPLSRAPDRLLRENIDNLWDDWSEESDAAGELDFAGLEAQVARSWFEGGEVFVRFRPRRPEDGLTVPLQLQILEAEHVPADMHEQAENGNIIKHGVEFDAIGRRVAYYMYRQHPGEFHDAEFMRDDDVAFGQTVRVPAREVLHIYLPSRPGMKRGEPALTQTLVTLRDLDAWQDAELMRQKMGAMFLGFIKRPNPDDEGPKMGPQDEQAEAAAEHQIGASDEPSPEIQNAQPGSVMELADGQDINWSDPPEVGSTYESFVRNRMRAIAKSVGQLYEQLSGDYSQIDDRTYRAEHNEMRRQVESLQNHVIIAQFCRPVWRRFFTTALVSGALDLGQVRQDRARRVQWIPQGFRHIHPVQDVQAKRQATRSGFQSRQEIVREEGRNVHEVEREIAEENARADELGLVFDSDARQVNQSGAAHGADPGFDDNDSAESDPAQPGGRTT